MVAGFLLWSYRFLLRGINKYIVHRGPHLKSNKGFECFHLPGETAHNYFPSYHLHFALFFSPPTKQPRVWLWSNKFPQLCWLMRNLKPILRVCAVCSSRGALQNKPAPFDWIRRQKTLLTRCHWREFHICAPESMQLKVPFYFLFPPFHVTQFASLPQSGDLSKVVVFSVCTIYLNSIITDNLLANFKAECA